MYIYLLIRHYLYPLDITNKHYVEAKSVHKCVNYWLLRIHIQLHVKTNLYLSMFCLRFIICTFFHLPQERFPQLNSIKK